MDKIINMMFDAQGFPILMGIVLTVAILLGLLIVWVVDIFLDLDRCKDAENTAKMNRRK